MEFRFQLQPIFKGVKITSWDKALIQKLPAATKQNLGTIIDTLGNGSAKAQNLPQVITSMSRFLVSDHKLYIYVEDNKVYGFLKMGYKHLFIRSLSGEIAEITPYCCLDFYVNESAQRMGVGKQLFDACVAEDGIPPHKIAYDRPSQKLIPFLRKHYGLSKYVPQNNNFVVFDNYFEHGFHSDRNRRGPTPPSAVRQIAPVQQPVQREKTPESRTIQPEVIQEEDVTRPLGLLKIHPPVVVSRVSGGTTRSFQDTGLISNEPQSQQMPNQQVFSDYSEPENRESLYLPTVRTSPTTVSRPYQSPRLSPKAVRSEPPTIAAGRPSSREKAQAKPPTPTFRSSPFAVDETYANPFENRRRQTRL
ncbi:putative Alpha-tubulin N-acetyltransferase [Blattamonas nauphoetae]|uniref:Alpha-tubulin N-acetyltransferase n=1 Tax=Blattamonas nauphoetae TaxID=2049346 RepID=A0ABQ9Y067_9EUKA|nr:putative Alpha-tubulin N-acetyltransferase [Blattamonas nauphoetae]